MKHAQQPIGKGDDMVMTAPVMEYLTPGDAALVLGLSAQGVRLAAENGRIRVAARTAGGVRLFTREDVERFKRERAKVRK